MIALSCGIKISAVRHLVLSQCMRVTDRQTDGQNYYCQDRSRICSRGKNQDNSNAIITYRSHNIKIRLEELCLYDSYLTQNAKALSLKM